MTRIQKHSGRADLYTKAEREAAVREVEHLRLTKSITDPDSEHTRIGLLGNTLWADAYFRMVNHGRLAAGASLTEIALETTKASRDYLIAVIQGAVLSHPDSHRIEGKWLASLRTSNGMTQSQLADRLDIKKNSITRWESGHRPVNNQRQTDLRRIFIPLWAEDVAKWEMAATLHDLKRLHDNGEMPPGLEGTEKLDWMMDEWGHAPTVRLARQVIPKPPWLIRDDLDETFAHDPDDHICWAARDDKWWGPFTSQGVYQLPEQKTLPSVQQGVGQGDKEPGHDPNRRAARILEPEPEQIVVPYGDRRAVLTTDGVFSFDEEGSSK